MAFILPAPNPKSLSVIRQRWRQRQFVYVERFLLRDTFGPTDLAAGSVNGTAAEPGPGVRTVTDTENKLSLSGGEVVFAGGKAAPAWGDPGLWYGAQTRAAGLAISADHTFSALANSTIGWDSATAGQSDRDSLGVAGTTLRVWTNGGVVAAGTVAPTTVYGLAVILRTGGAFWYLRDGTGTAWRLIWADTINTDATLYPSATNFNSSFDVDYIKVAQLSWLPAPLTSDGFGTAGALATTDGLGHAEGIAGGIGSGGGGKVWTGATWTAAAGKASNTPGTGGELVTNGGMEGTYDTEAAGVDIAPDWDLYDLAGADTASKEESLIHSGAAAQKFTTGGPSRGIRQSVNTTFALGDWCIVSVWARGGVGGEKLTISNWTGAWPTYLYNNATLTTAYANYTVVVRSTGTFERLTFIGGNEGLGGTYYIDDVSVLLLTLSTLFASTTHSTADVLATVAVTLTAGTQAGVVVNLDSAATPANFVIAYHDGTNCLLEKCVAGTYTTVITAAAAYSAGAELRVIKDGTGYRLYYNNALVGTGTIADAGIVSNTLHGLFSTYSANTLDDFTVYARGTAGEYDAPLNEVANG